MFNGANSKAPRLGQAPYRPLDATYGMHGRRAAQPLDHDMLVIEPPPAAVIGSTATRFPRKVPGRLTSITLGPAVEDLEATVNWGSSTNAADVRHAEYRR